MDGPNEIELKLEGEPAAFAGLALFGAAPGRTEWLAATYFDTPDQQLAAAGYSLRIRQEGDRRVQTVKASDGAAAGLFMRPEWECPADGDTPRLDPAAGPLAQLLPQAALAALAPVFTTEVTRTIRDVETDGARVEIAFDKGVLRGGGRTAPVCELELELKDGVAGALFDLARRIDGEAPVRLGVRSKAERGYALAADRRPEKVKAEPIRLDSGGDARDGFAAIAHGCIRQFRLNEAILLETGGADALHQARVGLRRLRSAFSLFGALFAGDERALLLRAELKWLAAELGEVRNLDVLIPRFEGAAADTLATARAARFEHVRVALESGRTRMLMIDLVEWLALGRWRSDPADPALAERPLPQIACEILEKHRKRLKKRGADLAALDDHDRHQVRIEAKKLRYATEFFAGLFTDSQKGARRHKAFLEAMEVLQDRLGELNDRVTAPHVLGSLGLPDALPRNGPATPKLLRKAEEAYDALIDVKRFWR